MEEINSISITSIYRKLKNRKKLFLKVWSITLILSILWIFPQPRTYKAEIMLAPEAAGGTGSINSLSSLASSFGFDFNGMASQDAIYPELYPQLMSSNDFIVNLLDVPVETIDGEIKTDLYTYIKKHQKYAFYMEPVKWGQRQIRRLTAKPVRAGAGKGKNINPFMLSEEQFGVVENLKGSVSCMVDKLTNVFTIRVVAQDPLVAATLADSVSSRLQRFIINYRTNKARVDLKHYEALTQKAKKEYDEAVAKYSSFQESHYDAFSKSVTNQANKLERAQEQAYNTYTALFVQMETAKARLQERIPAFTILQNPSVPIKPDGPRRVLFIFFMMILATIVTTGCILSEEMKQTVKFFTAR